MSWRSAASSTYNGNGKLKNKVKEKGKGMKREMRKVTISMEWGLEERPSSLARERARSRTLQTWAASWEASFPFMVFSTSASAFLLSLSISISISSLPPSPQTHHKYLPLPLPFPNLQFAIQLYLRPKIIAFSCFSIHLIMFY